MMVSKQVGVMRMCGGWRSVETSVGIYREGCFVAFNSEFLLLDSENSRT